MYLSQHDHAALKYLYIWFKYFKHNLRTEISLKNYDKIVGVRKANMFRSILFRNTLLGRNIKNETISAVFKAQRRSGPLKALVDGPVAFKKINLQHIATVCIVLPPIVVLIRSPPDV